MSDKLREVIERWTNTQEVLLRTGEMSADEKRTAMAVLNGFARDLEKVLGDNDA